MTLFRTDTDADTSTGARTGRGARTDTRTGPVAAPSAGPRGFRVTAADRDILWLYLLTRAGLWVTAYCARWLFPADPQTHRAAPVLSSWQQWDWWYYLHIAQHGYFPGTGADSRTIGLESTAGDNREAFFPGFPLLLRAVHTVIPNWTAAGLLISFVTGGVAVLALARIARLDLDPDRGLSGADAGRRTVLFFLLSPCAVFLAVGYTESLFLALALPAWLAARRAAWPLAAILTALAATVRISGLFLAAAVAVHFLTTPNRRWPALPWLALPALPPLIYTLYLHAHTGDWLAWKHAENRGWYRDFHSPWQSWHHTWQSAFGHSLTTGYAIEFQAELLAMLTGLTLLALLLRRHRWPEATYLALTLWALGTSYWYMSIPRATLLWWPLWPLLAHQTHPHPRLTTAYLALSTPLTTIFALTFLSGRWAG